MARKRVAPFDPPTAEDFEALGPERVRRGPRGGFLWLCESEGCKQPASHLTVKGKKVCRSCGGSTAAQRDPMAHAEALAAGQEPPRPPGRPVVHGFYAVVPGVRVDEIVQRYRDEGLDPDATDDDMLYLRAYLDDLKTLRPDSMVVAELLLYAITTLNNFKRAMTDERNAQTGKAMSVDQVLRVMGLADDLAGNLDKLRETLKETRSVTAGLEERHSNLIGLAKVRAETRLKNSAAQQLDAFTVMVERLQVILAETLPSNYAEALQVRFARELAELPGRAAKGVKA